MLRCEADRLEDGLHQRGVALEAVLVRGLETVVVIEEVLLLGVRLREQAVEIPPAHETAPAFKFLEALNTSHSSRPVCRACPVLNEHCLTKRRAPSGSGYPRRRRPVRTEIRVTKAERVEIKREGDYEHHYNQDGRSGVSDFRVRDTGPFSVIDVRPGDIVRRDPPTLVPLGGPRSR
jgi:hypothetical protein